jgi:hypothetical protein
MKVLNITLFFVLLSSCAPQDEKKIGILGRWKLSRFLCYVGEPGTVDPSAQYVPADSSNTIEVLVDGRNLVYNAAGTSGTTASTTVNGTYIISSRVTVDEGAVSYTFEGAGNAVTLAMNAQAPSGGTSTAVAVIATLDASAFNNRFFRNAGSQMFLELPIAFTGGSDANCSGACTSCVAVLDTF